MAHTVYSIPIAGLRKAHLKQLAGYILDQDGSYYGNKRLWDARHEDLVEFASLLLEYAEDEDLRIAKREGR